MDVAGSGIDFYYWINLWYSSLDLIKVYLEEIQEELKKTRNPNFALHPKLKFRSHTKRQRDKDREKQIPVEENKNEQKEKLNAESFVELQEISMIGKDMNLSAIKNNKIIKDDDVYFRHNLTPYEDEKSQVFESPEIEGLYNIIEKLNHNTDLNVIIDTISQIKIKETKSSTFTRDNLNIFLHANELDKFDNFKKMMKEFCVQINFSLLEK
jgi:hypothetical protein